MPTTDERLNTVEKNTTDIKSNLGKLTKRLNPFGKSADASQQEEQLSSIRMSTNISSFRGNGTDTSRMAKDIAASLDRLGESFIKDLSEENQKLISNMITRVGGLLSKDAEVRDKSLSKIMEESRELIKRGEETNSAKMKALGEDMLKSATEIYERDKGMNLRGSDDNRLNQIARDSLEVNMESRLKADPEDSSKELYNAEDWQTRKLEERGIKTKGFGWEKTETDADGNTTRRMLTKDELRDEVRDVNNNTTEGKVRGVAKVAREGGKNLLKAAGRGLWAGLKDPLRDHTKPVDRNGPLTDEEKRQEDAAKALLAKDVTDSRMAEGISGSVLVTGFSTEALAQLGIGSDGVGSELEGDATINTNDESLSSAAEEAAGMDTDPSLEEAEKQTDVLEDIRDNLAKLGAAGAAAEATDEKSDPDEQSGTSEGGIMGMVTDFLTARAGTTMLGGATAGTLMAGAAGIGMAGYAAYNAYNDYNEADQLVETGAINDATGISYTQLDEDAQKSEAIGRGVGGASGALAGAATGAMIGSAIPVVGTAIGGIVGAGLGYFAGDSIGNTVGDWMSTSQEEQSLSDAEDSGLYDSNIFGDSTIDKNKLAQTNDVAQLNAILNDNDLSDEDRAAVEARLGGIEDQRLQDLLRGEDTKLTEGLTDASKQQLKDQALEAAQLEITDAADADLLASLGADEDARIETDTRWKVDADTGERTLEGGVWVNGERVTGEAADAYLAAQGEADNLSYEDLITDEGTPVEGQVGEGEVSKVPTEEEGSSWWDTAKTAAMGAIPLVGAGSLLWNNKDAIASTAGDVLSSTGNFLGDTATGALALGEDAIDATGNFLGDAASGIGSMASGAWNSITDFVGDNAAGAGIGMAVGGPLGALAGMGISSLFGNDEEDVASGENEDGGILDRFSDFFSDEKEPTPIVVPPPTVIQSPPPAPAIPTTGGGIRNTDSSWMRFANKRTMAQ